MRFGAITHTWQFPLTDDLASRLVARLPELGGDHIELSGEFEGTIDRAALKGAIDERGMTVSIGGITGTARDPSSLDPAVRAEARAYGRWCVDLAVDVGATIIGAPWCGTGGRAVVPASEREQRLELAAAALRELGDYAGEAGTVIAVEPLNRFENNFLNTSAQVRELVELTSHPQVRMMLDAFHMNIEETSIGEAIRTAGSLLVHLQVAENHRGTPGTGSFPWREFADALTDVGYDGAVVIETVNPDDPIVAPVACMWRHLADDMDTLVRDGLTFLRATLGSDRP